jgi:Ca-activated chloride channel family protein
MKPIKVLFSLTVLSLVAAPFFFAQDGPSPTTSDTVARPRKKADSTTPAEEDQPKIPSKFSNKNKVPEGTPTFSTDATTVSVDVAVIDSKGNFIPKIPKNYFRILEDNVPQQVSGYSIGEAPMTVALVVEFSAKFQNMYTQTWYQTLTAAYGFVQSLKPEDYVAVIAYDIRPEILSDFSVDRADAQEALQRLRIPAFSEANLYDSLVFTAERMQDIEGRKAILVLTSGIDTFSKLTYDKTRRALQESGVPVYAISLMQALRIQAEGSMGAIQQMDFLQADNGLRTFSKETGGLAFFPRFFGEFPGIFRDIAQALRNQYVLTYTPSNQERDGKFRKIKVEVIDPATGEPLRVLDEKQKPVKYQIVAKQGYKAPRSVE